MTDFAGIFRTIDGIVTITDSKDDPNRSTGTIRINDNTLAIIFRGLKGATEFIEKYIKPSSNKNIEEILQNANNAFEQHHNDYKKDDFSFIIAGFVRYRQTILYGLWYTDGNPSPKVLTDIYIFPQSQQDLIQYLTSKVYSEHMLLEEILQIVGYVTLQCIKIFPEIGWEFELNTISEKKIKTLSEQETRDVFHKSEKIDHKLKKVFSDFFLIDELKK